MGPNQTYKLPYNKGSHKQNERQRTDWEKIFANGATNKGLKIMATSNAMRMCSNKDSHSLSMGMQKGTDTLEDGLEFT